MQFICNCKHVCFYFLQSNNLRVIMSFHVSGILYFLCLFSYERRTIIIIFVYAWLLPGGHIRQSLLVTSCKNLFINNISYTIHTYKEKKKKKQNIYAFAFIGCQVCSVMKVNYTTLQLISKEKGKKYNHQDFNVKTLG